MGPPITAALLILLAAAQAGVTPTPAPISRPPPSLAGALTSGGFGTPLTPQTSLATQGLPPVGDAAPQCRSACTQTRVVCGVDDSDCTDRWRQCVAACRAPDR